MWKNLKKFVSLFGRDPRPPVVSEDYVPRFEWFEREFTRLMVYCLMGAMFCFLMCWVSANLPFFILMFVFLMIALFSNDHRMKQRGHIANAEKYNALRLQVETDTM